MMKSALVGIRISCIKSKAVSHFAGEIEKRANHSHNLAHTRTYTASAPRTRAAHLSYSKGHISFSHLAHIQLFEF
jgi:hypothetical protein